MFKQPPGHSLLIAGTLGVLFILTFAYGFQFHFGAEHKAFYFRTWSVVFCACLGMISWGVAQLHWTYESYSPPDWLAPVVTMFFLTASMYFWLPTVTALMIAGLTFVVVLVLLYFKLFRTAIYIMLATNVILIIGLISTKDFSEGADMLPLMLDANSYFLGGQDPYAQKYSNLFFYLPLQWLVYLPFAAAHIDLRWENLLFLAIVSITVVVLVRLGRLRPIAFLILCPILVSRSSIEMVLRGLVWPYWYFFLAFATTFMLGVTRVTAVLLGVLVAIQQPAALIGALVTTYLLRTQGFRAAFKISCLAGTVSILFLIPWMLERPALPMELYVTIQKQIAQQHVLEPEWDWSQVSLLNLLQAVGLGGLRRTAQIVVLCSGLASVILMRNLRVGVFLCICGLAYITAISLNVQVFKYYYYPGLILLGLGIASPNRRSKEIHAVSQ